MFTMMQTMNHFNPAAKTAEIMSRYRPIAPKPELPSPLNPNLRRAPYDLFPQLQSRPTRSSKRNRTSISPISLKRARSNTIFGFSPVQHSVSGLTAIVTAPDSLVTLPLLPSIDSCKEAKRVIDLNAMAVEITEEIDNQTQLQLRAPTVPNNGVISPRPIRPIGSTILVGSLIEDDDTSKSTQFTTKTEEFEEEFESESLPAMVSDSKNRVRLVNSAYKELVGQPECSWLDSMVTADHGRACKRIGGEVMLRFSESSFPATLKKGFSCSVLIEWGNNGDKKSVNVHCDVVRLMCESKDYVFAWKFHTRTISQPSSSSFEV